MAADYQHYSHSIVKLCCFALICAWCGLLRIAFDCGISHGLHDPVKADGILLISTNLSLDDTEHTKRLQKSIMSKHFLQPKTKIALDDDRNDARVPSLLHLECDNQQQVMGFEQATHVSMPKSLLNVVSCLHRWQTTLLVLCVSTVVDIIIACVAQERGSCQNVRAMPPFRRRMARQRFLGSGIARFLMRLGIFFCLWNVWLSKGVLADWSHPTVNNTCAKYRRTSMGATSSSTSKILAHSRRRQLFMEGSSSLREHEMVYPQKEDVATHA